ncbi:MAG: MBOAT family protein [Gracilibacteraceae bacterium]|jgi:D-alanyl-lipoteichoic acid acyltransferase DltB (MBOAT superfamily)|nr:MBOAT family protein [Gracilibacteraceae bacterium]
MLFTSFSFLLFLALLLPAYYCLGGRRQWRILLAGSLIFYAFSGWRNLLYIGATVVSSFIATTRMANLLERQETYLAEHRLSAAESKSYRRGIKRRRLRWLIASLAVNLGILAVVKYTGFAADNLARLLPSGAAWETGGLHFLLPLGLSFYTFQVVGYNIDMYRSKTAEATERSVFRLALFVSFFPQIIQGPISRWGDLRQTLFTPRRFCADDFSAGLLRALFGLGKKLLVADRLLAAVRTLTADPAEFYGVYVLVAVFLYAVTLYADFTGGIDMTVGIARMFGVRVTENFRRPFYSASIAEYWRRWHITMGTWFRDYLFYPLSLSRPLTRLGESGVKLLGKYWGRRLPVWCATMVTWLATGVWHGASWNFVVWGGLNGVVILISQELIPLYKSFHARWAFSNTKFYHAFQVLRTFWLMCFIRSFDIYAGVGLTCRMLLSVAARFDGGRFAAAGLSPLGLAAADYVIAFLAVGGMIIVGRVQAAGAESRFAAPPARLALCGALAVMTLVFGAYGPGYDARQFIYNRF